jgi:hypothetical protein
MARCKCKICGLILDSNTAFKVIDKNGKNKYYCSDSEYQDEEQRKQKEKAGKDAVYDVACEIFGYKVKNTAFFKEWNEWLELKCNEIIAKYLQENKDYLTGAISRLSSGEYAKIRYLSTVLKNSLVDFKPKSEEKPKPIVDVDMTIYDTPTQSHNRRRSLADLEDEI